MKTNIKIISVMILSFFLIGLSFCFNLNVEKTISQPVDNITRTTNKNEVIDDLPAPTTDEIANKLEGKAYDIVSLLQRVGQPICIVIFIGSAFVTLFGVFARTGFSKGIIGMLVSGLVFCAIKYAPEIVFYIQNWAVS